ncbi:MAG: dihydrolipoyl dehydrogenase [Oscillospiraceae bacterium]|nr:dihydrolipoyl dehydrogenase [Oscillospiraceae bacterium]
MENFDVLIIGGGPGGYLCAERASQGGFKTALIEMANLGGTCLNEGCVPTKSLLYCAKQYAAALHGKDYGFTASEVKYDHAAVVARKDRVVKKLVAGVGATMKSHNITVFKGLGEIQGKNSVKGYDVKVGDEIVTADRLVLATGSVVAVPPIPGVKEGIASGFVVTSREFLSMKELPAGMVAIGGGVIGLEMACYLATAGVKVTVVEMMPKIAGPTDQEICDNLMKTYQKDYGMKFELSAKVKEVKADCVVFEDKDGKTVEAKCDKVLLAAGRRANIAGLNVEALGIETNRGAVVTDRFLLTNVPNVYAVGDCNGKLMLAHTAYREAEVAVNHMLGVKDEMKYDHIASVIYTNPEVAAVGLSKAAAEGQGMKVKEVKVPMQLSGRYIAETLRGDGFAKIVYDLENNRLVGICMVGSYASEMIYGASLMLDTELPLSQLKKLVFPHPTVSEVIREGLFML